MIHPHTELRFINHKKGRGIFATQPIPKGTIMYVRDDLEIIIPPMDPRLSDPNLSEQIKTYSFIDHEGNYVLSWDEAKYVNHCCQCNTMSTGYGFEISIRDIEKDEEVTDEYGMFNLEKGMKLECAKSPCRKVVTDDDFDKFFQEWDETVKNALVHFSRVEQPLKKFLNLSTLKQLIDYLKTGKNYVSVIALKSIR